MVAIRRSKKSGEIRDFAIAAEEGSSAERSSSFAGGEAAERFSLERDGAAGNKGVELHDYRNLCQCCNYVNPRSKIFSSAPASELRGCWHPYTNRWHLGSTLWFG